MSLSIGYFFLLFVVVVVDRAASFGLGGGGCGGCGGGGGGGCAPPPICAPPPLQLPCPPRPLCPPPCAPPPPPICLPPPMPLPCPPQLPPPPPIPCPPMPICPPPVFCPPPPLPPPPPLCPPQQYCPPPLPPPPPPMQICPPQQPINPCGGGGGYGVAPGGFGGGSFLPQNDCCGRCASPCRFRSRRRLAGVRIGGEAAMGGGERTVGDPTCSNIKLRAIIKENITRDPNITKRAVQKAIEEALGGKWNVICANGDFAYVAYTDDYCQTSFGDITCYAFRSI